LIGRIKKYVMDQEIDNILLKEGIMKREENKLWKRKYYQFKNYTLLQYPNENNTKEVEWRLNFSMCMNITIEVQSKYRGEDSSFSINYEIKLGQKNTIMFSAETKEERIKWVKQNN
jgi:hypothetical protein